MSSSVYNFSSDLPGASDWGTDSEDSVSSESSVQTLGGSSVPIPEGNLLERQAASLTVIECSFLTCVLKADSAVFRVPPEYLLINPI